MSANTENLTFLEGVARNLGHAYNFQVPEAYKPASGERIPSFIMSAPIAANRSILSWHTMMALLQELGATVYVAPPEYTVSTFIRDAALSTPDKTILPNPDDPIMGVYRTNNKPLAAYGMLQTTKPFFKSPRLFEGGNILLDPHAKRLFIGFSLKKYGQSSEKIVKEHQKELIENLKQQLPEYKIIPLRMQEDPHHRTGYHLDLCMAVLPRGDILASRKWFNTLSWSQLEKAVGAENLIVADVATQQGLGLNLVAIGNTLVMPKCSAVLKEILERRHYKVVTPEVLGLPAGSFQVGNGAIHCVTQEVCPEEFPLSWVSRLQSMERGPNGSRGNT